MVTVTRERPLNPPTGGHMLMTPQPKNVRTITPSGRAYSICRSASTLINLGSRPLPISRQYTANIRDRGSHRPHPGTMMQCSGGLSGAPQNWWVELNLTLFIIPKCPPIRRRLHHFRRNCNHSLRVTSLSFLSLIISLIRMHIEDYILNITHTITRAYALLMHLHLINV